MIVNVAPVVIRVHGIPKPKGSLKHVGRGRLQEQVEGSKPWREAVKWAALDAVRGRSGFPLDGPVEVEVVYAFPKPKSAPKTRRTWPITRSSGDLDKLHRNVLDALVDAAVLGDDSQVVKLTGTKAYVGEDVGVLLDHPGAWVIVRPLPEAVWAAQQEAAAGGDPR